jgi:tetratricopeptide (TPR) repeat protein
VSLVEQAEGHLTRADQAAWLDRLDREQGNIRAVLQNALERGDAETVIRLSGAFWRFWYLHGQLGEGRRWLESALAISDGISLPLRIKAFSGAGFLAANLGDYAQARQWCEQALRLAQAWGNKEFIAAAVLSLATTGVWQGDEFSVALYAQALRLYQELEDPAGTALATGYLAFAHWFRGDYEEAHRLFQEALRQMRALNNQSGIAFALYGLGFAALNQRDDETALRRFREALEIMQALGDKRGLIRAY